MIRYSLFILAVAGSAATAWATIVPVAAIPVAKQNVTVVEKNEFWPVESTLKVEKCEVEDCSDTPQG